jgi:UDP-N-acetylmuramoylalanine--D-glutamate ligase
MTSNCTRHSRRADRSNTSPLDARETTCAWRPARQVGAVWGTGREGRAAVTAIARYGPSRLIAVDDSANFLSVPWEGELAALAPLAGGDHAFGALVAADVVVRSPGVPQTHPWMAELRDRGVTVTGGSALWMADHARRTVGVTGSKGKSTTSELISHLLTAVGRPNVFGGNIGVPLLDLPRAEQYVLELSSYQCSRPDRLAAGGGGDRAVPRAPGRARRRAGVLPRQAQPARHGPEMIVVNGADQRLMRGR